MKDYWASSTDSAPITLDTLKAAVDRVYNDPFLRVCTHVVGPHDKGWSICANCFGPVYVPEGRI